MALFLAFVMLGSATTWAATPPATRDWWVASVRDSAAGYAEYIEKYSATDPANPRLEKAYFRLADKTNSLTDLRHYQGRYPRGTYAQQVREKIGQLEGKAVAEIQKQPEAAKIQQFLIDFPDADRLPEVKQAAEQLQPGQRAALLSAIETGYVRTMQLHPSRQKLEQYLHDFPALGRLTDMAETVCPLTAVLPDVQPALDKVIEEKVQAATTLAEVQAVLPALQAGGSRQAAERVAQIVLKKPASLSKQLTAEVQKVRAQVEQRQCALQIPEGAVPESAGSTSTDPAAQSLDTSKPAQKLSQNNGTGAATTTNSGAAPSQPGTQSAPDADGDGIPDSADQCPNEKGAAVDKGCPPQAQALSNRKSGLSMVRVAGGTFNMGSPEDQVGRSKGECPHSVTVAAFSIGQYEVTQADWREVMGSDALRLHNTGCDDCPVENVSWNDVQDFLKTLNKAPGGKQYRLPTEAEWEYAARDGAQSKGYLYAGSDRLHEVAWYEHNYKAGNTFGSKTSTRPVGTKKPNALGLYDMSGNVWEWCDDLYNAYPNCEADYTGQVRVLRGGSWKSEAPDCRAAHRFASVPNARTQDVGFRLALGQ